MPAAAAGGAAAAAAASKKDAKRAARAALEARERERAARVKAALLAPDGAPRSVLAELPAFARFDRNGLECDVFQTSVEASNWTPALESWVFELTKRNMSDLYNAAPGWAWGDKKKRAELFVPEMRFLVAQARGDGALLGFVAFTCLLEAEYDSLYVFELQLAAAAQRKGLGKHLMQTLELAARKLGLPWLLLTVLKSNASALAFYTGKLKYEVCELSPSKHGEHGVAHEILAKCVDAKGWAASQAASPTAAPR